MYKKISKILDLHWRHLVPGVPTQYVLYLRCCYEKNCIHPRCRRGRPEEGPSWYPGGPPLSFAPLPAVVPGRPAGRDDCPQCPQLCLGHYLKPQMLQKSFKNGTQNAVKPPSEVLLAEMKQLKYEMPSDHAMLELSKEVLLAPEETKMWLEHLCQIHRNRVDGARNAAQKRATAKQKSRNQSREEDETKCIICDSAEPEVNNEDDVLWICCDGCTKWCHCLCAGISDSSKIAEMPHWLCLACRENWS